MKLFEMLRTGPRLASTISDTCDPLQWESCETTQACHETGCDDRY
jgi:hypothetical protein